MDIGIDYTLIVGPLGPGYITLSRTDGHYSEIIGDRH